MITRERLEELADEWIDSRRWRHIDTDSVADLLETVALDRTAELEQSTSVQCEKCDEHVERIADLEAQIVTDAAAYGDDRARVEAAYEKHIANLERLNDLAEMLRVAAFDDRDQARNFAIDMRNLNEYPDDPDLVAPWETKP